MQTLWDLEKRNIFIRHIVHSAQYLQLLNDKKKFVKRKEEATQQPPAANL